MTHSSTWKALERRIAAQIGSRRTPLSGSNSAQTSSDTLHVRWYIEAKLRARIPAYKLYMDTKRKAALEHKLPIVVLHQKNTKENIALLSFDDLAELLLAGEAGGKEAGP